MPGQPAVVDLAVSRDLQIRQNSPTQRTHRPLQYGAQQTSALLVDREFSTKTDDVKSGLIVQRCI